MLTSRESCDVLCVRLVLLWEQSEGFHSDAFNLKRRQMRLRQKNVEILDFGIPWCRCIFWV